MRVHRNSASKSALTTNSSLTYISSIVAKPYNHNSTGTGENIQTTQRVPLSLTVAPTAYLEMVPTLLAAATAQSEVEPFPSLQEMVVGASPAVPSRTW